VWNETGGGGLLASGGGASTYFPKPLWQTGPGVPNDNARDVPDVSFSASGNHDPYTVVNANGVRATGGTSASSPSFAGVVALLNHYVMSKGIQAVPGLGNINPQLYKLAQSTTNVFHDITVGNNMVPCSPGSLDCSASGMIGFNAGPGYDQATGLGSIDVYNLFTQWNTPAAASTTVVAVNPGNITLGHGRGVGQSRGIRVSHRHGHVYLRDHASGNRSFTLRRSYADRNRPAATSREYNRICCV
jgi:subtilase family serine protease